jgi:hypothetical protein
MVQDRRVISGEARWGEAMAETTRLRRLRDRGAAALVLSWRVAAGHEGVLAALVRPKLPRRRLAPAGRETGRGGMLKAVDAGAGQQAVIRGSSNAARDARLDALLVGLGDLAAGGSRLRRHHATAPERLRRCGRAGR